MFRVEYLEIEETRIPTMHLAIKNDYDEIVYDGWLSPFRGYKFQVSKTKDGEWDKGSSGVIGLKHCLVPVSSGRGYESDFDRDGIHKELIYGQIMLALTDWISGFHGNLSYEDQFVDMGDWWRRDDNNMGLFINKSLEFVRCL